MTTANQHRTLPARDLLRGDLIRHEGAWWTVGEAKPDWGTVVVLDPAGEYVTTYNHGDPVDVVRISR